MFIFVYKLNYMRTYKVTYMHRATPKARWTLTFKTVHAVSIEDARKRADLYPPLIKKIEQL
jgi:hypothetical protein